MDDRFIDPVVGVMVESHRLIADGDLHAQLIEFVDKLEVGIVYAVKLFEVGVICARFYKPREESTEEPSQESQS